MQQQSLRPIPKTLLSNRRRKIFSEVRTIISEYNTRQVTVRGCCNILFPACRYPDRFEVGIGDIEIVAHIHIEVRIVFIAADDIQ